MKKIFIFFILLLNYNYVLALDDTPLTIMSTEEHYKLLPHDDSIIFKLLNDNLQQVKSIDGKIYSINSKDIRDKILNTCVIGEKCYISGTFKGKDILSISNVKRNFDIDISNISTNGFGIFGFSLNDTYEQILDKAKKLGFCISHSTLTSTIKPLSPPIKSSIEKGAWPSISLFNTFPPFNSKFVNDNFKLQNLIKNNPKIFPYIEIWGNSIGKDHGIIKLNFYFLNLPDYSSPKMFSFILESTINDLNIVNILNNSYDLLYDFPDDYFLRNLGGFYVWKKNNDYVIFIHKMGAIFYSPQIIKIIDTLNQNDFIKVNKK